MDLHSVGGGPNVGLFANTALMLGVKEGESMLPRWLTALLVLLREAWPTRRDAHIRFLKLQVEMLQSRLPGNRVSRRYLNMDRLYEMAREEAVMAG